MNQNLLIWLHEIDPEVHHELSDSIVRLAHLAKKGLPVVPSFIITPHAFTTFLDSNNLSRRWQDHLDQINFDDPISLQENALRLQNLVLSSSWPEELQNEILDYYLKLTASPSKSKFGLSLFKKDLPVQIKLGAGEPFTGESNLFNQLKAYWASFLTPQSLREKNITPKTVIVRLHLPGVNNANVVASSENIEELQKGVQKEFYFPHEIEFVHQAGKLLINAIRPSTSISAVSVKEPEMLSRSIIFQGVPASPGIRSGSVKHVSFTTDSQVIGRGDVIVATKLEKHQLPMLKHAAALILGDSSLHSSAVLEAKRQGVPTVVGANAAVSTLEHRANIIVNGSTGEITFGTVEIPREEIKPYHNATTIELPSTSPKLTTATKLWQLFFDGDELHNDSDGVVIRNNSLLNIDVGQKIYPKTILLQVNKESSAEELVLTLRNKLRLKNISLLFSEVDSPTQLEQLKTHYSSKGLHRSNSLHYWLLVKTPAQLLELPSFLNIGIDGVYIDASQLASLTSGQEGAEIDGATLKLIAMGLSELKKHSLPTMVEVNDLRPIPELILLGAHHIVVRGKLLSGARIDTAEAEHQLILGRS